MATTESYKLGEVIGRGGGGAVYLAKRRNSVEGRSLVVKKILLDQQKERTKESVIREARILEKLRHPNIVAFVESFFEKDGHEEYLYLVQDYCDGGSLADVIRKAKQDVQLLSESAIMKWFLQVTMGLQYIHSQKVLHRDLKASNVFLTKSGRVKIGDFGISRELHDTEEQAMTCIGTPQYLSPELCEDQPYNSKSDMWALGCLLYELCALRPPFTAGNLLGLYYKIVKGQLQPLPSIYSSFLRRLTSELLNKSPQQRPAAGALLQWPGIQNLLQDFVKETEANQAARRLRRSSGKTAAPLLPGQEGSLKLRAQCKAALSSPSSPYNPLLARQVELPLTVEKTEPSRGSQKQVEVTTVKTNAPGESSPPSSPLAVDYPDDFEEESDSDANLSPRHSLTSPNLSPPQSLSSANVSPHQSLTSPKSTTKNSGSVHLQSRSSLREGILSPYHERKPSVSPSADYDEDFEEYESESDEELDDVISKTRKALSQDVVEDNIIDDNMPAHLVKALKKCCLETVGTEQLQDALEMLEMASGHGHTARQAPQ